MIQKGKFDKEMTIIKHNAFEVMCAYKGQEDEVSKENKDTFKDYEALYFVEGNLINTPDGKKILRSNDMVESHELVVLDYDEGFTRTAELVRHDLDKRGLKYILTPTPSYTADNERWRLILALDKPCPVSRYEEVVNAVEKDLNYGENDSSSSNNKQLQGMPIVLSNGDDEIKPFYKTEGEPLQLDKYLQVKESPLTLQGDVEGVLVVKGEFEQALREYAKRMGDKLYEGEYDGLWRNTLFSLRRTLKDGRISVKAAHNVIRVLWADKAELANANIKWFDRQNENIKMDKHIDEWITLNDSDIAYYSQQSNAEWVEYDKNGTRHLRHNVLGDVLINEHHIVHYPTKDSSLYFYNASTGCYVEDARGEYIEALVGEKQRDAKLNFIREVRHYIKRTAVVIPSTSQTHIALGNCLWNFTTNEPVEFTPNEFVTSKIPTNYNPNASSDFVDTFLNKITQGHEPSKQNLIELLANVIYPTVLTDRMWFLYGPSAGNGKSTFLQMLKNAFSPDYNRISSVTPKKLAANNFAASDMYGKIANLVDDLPDEYIEDAGALKSIVSGQAITIERKGKDGFSGVITAPLIFGSNHFPRFRENGNSIMRRMMIIPFNHNFMSDSEALPMYDVDNMLRSDEVREYVLKLALDGVKQVKDNKGMPTPNDLVERALNSFETSNDPLGTYLKDLNAQDIIERNVGSKLLYAEYVSWCDDMGIDNPVGQRRFIQRVKEVLGLVPKQVKISGKPVRVFR